MTKKYYLHETRVVAIFGNKEDAESNKENYEEWFPENNYKVVEEEE